MAIRRPQQRKANAVIDSIRERIISGLRPNDRLPTFSEMETLFGVSRSVLRDAIEELKRDGFIYSVDRQGLFVADRPPHLSRFAIVHAHNPSSPKWPRFYTALHQEAVAYQQGRDDVSFRDYYDLARGPESDGYQRLLADVEAHRSAGLILMPGTHHIGQSEPFQSLGVPRVYCFGATEVGRVPSIATDDVQMCDKMIGWLRERGRRRLAAVAIWGNSELQREYLTRQGVPGRPHWIQTVARENLAEVRRIVPLLMDYPADQRPDGLIILDDNLTEHAVGGLLDCNMKVGQDIDVIAHCNWPWPVASPAPIRRVGFHARHMLLLAIRAIELLRQGKPLGADLVKVPALFEEQVTDPWEPTGFDPTEQSATT